MADPETYEREHDEEILEAVDREGDIEEDPEEDEPVDDSIGYTGVHIHTYPPLQDLTPPASPLIPSDGEEADDEATDDEQTETAAAADEPPPDPFAGYIPRLEHEVLVGALVSRVIDSEARLDEVRHQLSLEREARRNRQGWLRHTTPEDVRRAITRVEQRHRARMRTLPMERGRVDMRAADEILRLAMSRVRYMTRGRG